MILNALLNNKSTLFFIFLLTILYIWMLFRYSNIDLHNQIVSIYSIHTSTCETKEVNMDQNTHIKIFAIFFQSLEGTKVPRMKPTL